MAFTQKTSRIVDTHIRTSAIFNLTFVDIFTLRVVVYFFEPVITFASIAEENIKIKIRINIYMNICAQTTLIFNGVKRAGINVRV